MLLVVTPTLMPRSGSAPNGRPIMIAPRSSWLSSPCLRRINCMLSMLPRVARSWSRATG